MKTPIPVMYSVYGNPQGPWYFGYCIDNTVQYSTIAVVSNTIDSLPTYAKLVVPFTQFNPFNLTANIKINLVNQSEIVNNQVTIQEIKKGDYFRFKDDENAPIWVRSEYNRSTKKYECYKYEDVNHFLECKGDRKVWLL